MYLFEDLDSTVQLGANEWIAFGKDKKGKEKAYLSIKIGIYQRARKNPPFLVSIISNSGQGWDNLKLNQRVFGSRIILSGYVSLTQKEIFNIIVLMDGLFPRKSMEWRVLSRKKWWNLLIQQKDVESVNLWGKHAVEFFSAVLNMKYEKRG